MLISSEQVFCDRDHLVRFEPEFSLKFLERCGCPKRFHSNNTAPQAHVSLPPESRRLLDRDPCCYMRWQDAISIFLRLMFEYILRRHRYDTRPDAFSNELLVGFYSETDFTTRCDKNHFRVSA